ncbi:MAG: flagellar hook-associated protein FlgL [Tumebacillaceae bacterium]
MRVTQNMMNTQMMSNLNANNNRLMQYQELLASGKRLNKPSDDPVGVGFAMRYDAQIAQNDQFQENVTAGTSQLEFMDTTMSNINDVLQRARELAVQGASASNSPDSRKAIGNETQQLYQQLLTIGNSQFSGRYIFNGQMTNVKPYDPVNNNAQYSQSDGGIISYSMSEGVSLQVNVNGDDAFGAPATAGNEANSDNAFSVLDCLTKAMNTNDTAGIQQALSMLDSRLDKLQYVRADVGARANRVELLDNRLKDIDTNLQKLLSDTEDADIPATITNLKTAENVQNASLSAGARIMQQTLVDFLK